MHDAIVIGAGLAGAGAAVWLRRAGRSVRVFSDGAAGTSFSTAAVAPDPVLAPGDVAWLVGVVPDVLRGSGARPMRVPAATGAVIEALAAPRDCLDLSAESYQRIAVVAPAISGAPSPADLAALLDDAAGGAVRFVAAVAPAAAARDDVLLTPGAYLTRLRDDAVRGAAFVRQVRDAVVAIGADAILLPSYVPAEIRAEVERAVGRPAFRLLGTYGMCPQGANLAEALGAALRASGADWDAPVRAASVRWDGAAWVVSCAGGMSARGKAVVLATGGPAGGGVVKNGNIALGPDPGVLPAYSGIPMRAGCAPFGPVADGFLPREMLARGAAEIGIAVDGSMRVVGAAAPGLFAAGAIATPHSRSALGLAWALGSALVAARGAIDVLR